MHTWSYIFVFSSVSTLCLCRDVSYHELVTLGVNCSSDDTCDTTLANRNIDRRNCACDQHCAYFGDCCLDAKNPTQSKSISSTDLICQKTHPNSGYFTIGKCRRGWRDAEIRKKCEDQPNPKDVLSSVPVTISSTTLTYKNHYCAACNGVRDELLYWRLGVDCPKLDVTMESYVRRNLTYVPRTRSWGVYINREFFSCDLKPEPKEKRYLRFCYPNLISKCSPSWTDEFIREKCEAYTAYMQATQHGKNPITYRNAHCAICNNIRPNILSCILQSRDFERTSFTTLFDINLEKGNAIGGGGSSPKCKQGEVYDPAFRRCQVLSCGLPFLELRNGSCVPKSG